MRLCETLLTCLERRQSYFWPFSFSFSLYFLGGDGGLFRCLMPSGLDSFQIGAKYIHGEILRVPIIMELGPNDRALYRPDHDGGRGEGEGRAVHRGKSWR